MEFLARPPFSPVPARMTRRLHQLDRMGDRRALYLRDYAGFVCNIMSALESGRIADTEWSLSLLDLFSDFYFSTLESVHPFPTTRPPAWEAAHRLAGDGAVPCETVLLAALNAHMNNDLPQALAVRLDREWPMCSTLLRLRQADFWRVTDVIAEAPHAACPGWDLPGLIERWRADAWDNAMSLVTAPDSRWQGAICEDIEHAALKRAHLIACLPAVRQDLVTLPTHELHRVFDDHRDGGCRCGIRTAPCDSWVTAGA